MKPEFREKLFDFFKDAHSFQFDRREKINGRLGILLAIFTLVVNIAFKYLDDPPKLQAHVSTIAFYSMLLISLFLASGTLYNMCKALAKTLDWKYPPTPQRILKFIEKKEAENTGLPDEEKIDIKEKFETNLIRQFAEAATNNGVANSARSRHLLRTTQWTVATIVALIACAPFYYYLKFNAEKPPQRVEIVRPDPMRR